MGRPVRHSLTREEVQRLLATPNVDSTRGLRARAILETLLGAGLRAQELCDLKVRDVDFAAGELRVNAGKGDKARVVAPRNGTRQWLKLWNGRRQKRSDAFFHTSSGKALSRQAVHGIVRTAAAKAGIAQCWPHSLRHTCFTLDVRDGVPLPEVQEKAGHASLRTTGLYLHSTREERQATAKALRPLSGDGEAEITAPDTGVEARLERLETMVGRLVEALER